MNEKREWNFHNIAVGLTLIAVAICMLISKTAMFQQFPMIKIGLCIIIGFNFIESMYKKSFFGMSFSVGLATCVFREELGLSDIHYLIILIAFALIGIGLSLIFKRKRKITYDQFQNGNEYVGRSEFRENDGSFNIENSLGTKTQYIQIKELRNGKISNGLGTMAVYFSGSTISRTGAYMHVENGLGKLAVYFPREFRAALKSNNGLGKIDVHGQCSTDMNAPLINVDVDNGLGKIDFYFE